MQSISNSYRNHKLRRCHQFPRYCPEDREICMSKVECLNSLKFVGAGGPSDHHQMVGRLHSRFSSLRLLPRPPAVILLSPFSHSRLPAHNLLFALCAIANSSSSEATHQSRSRGHLRYLKTTIRQDSDDFSMISMFWFRLDRALRSQFVVYGDPHDTGFP